MNDFVVVVAVLGIFVRDLFLMPNKWFQGRLCIVYKKRLVRMFCRARTLIYVMKRTKSTQEKMWFTDFASNERINVERPPTILDVCISKQKNTKKNASKLSTIFKLFLPLFFVIGWCYSQKDWKINFPIIFRSKSIWLSWIFRCQTNDGLNLKIKKKYSRKFFGA